jgi:hypothetical protein
MDFCFRGVTVFCQNIIRNSAGQPTDILGISVNFGELSRKGLDIEASYRTPLDSIVSGWDGDLTLRALGTNVLSAKSNSFGIIHESAGENSGSFASWRWLLTATYNNDPLTASATLRTVSGGTYNNDYIQCTSGCPLSTVPVPTINNNHIPGATYVDLGGSYKFNLDKDRAEAELYFNVDNVADVDPPQVASIKGLPQTDQPYNASLYDTVGRMFHVGLRFRK